jgi:AbiV family abortive infection protein
MNRADLKKLSGLRLKEAKILLDNKSYEGAYYLAGYAVECALKACVAKKTKRYEFPPKNADKLYTHDLKALVALAGLKPDLDAETARVKELRDNWGNVKDWSEGVRYETGIDDKRAHDLYTAITSEPNGVLSWLKKYW